MPMYRIFNQDMCLMAFDIPTPSGERVSATDFYDIEVAEYTKEILKKEYPNEHFNIVEVVEA